jgi:hypothetical protein
MLMKPICPNCKESKFKYRDLLGVHPYPGEFAPASIFCPSCGIELRVMTRSRLLAAVILLGSIFGSLFLLLSASKQASDWQVPIIGLCALGIYYLLLWPVIVRFKAWTPFQYWLPKSRLVGHSVYLLLPLSLMGALVYLAAKFKVGM